MKWGSRSEKIWKIYRKKQKGGGTGNEEREGGGGIMDVDMSKEALREYGKGGEDRRRSGKEEEISRGEMGGKKGIGQRMETKKVRFNARRWGEDGGMSRAETWGVEGRTCTEWG